MWLLAVIVLLLLAPFIYLLFAPFFIEIDSTKGLFIFRFHKLVRVQADWNNGDPQIWYKVLFWKGEIDPFTPKTQKSVAKADYTEEKSAPKKKSAFRLNRRQVFAIVSSFKVQKCIIKLDTGDMPLNGLLYPWFFMLGYKLGFTILINFHGQEIFVMEVQNRLARMLWALVKRKGNK